MKLFCHFISLAIATASAMAAERVEGRVIVLTFDDAVKSHINNVAPVLKEHGFGATFFVTHLWMDDAENFMTWENIAELHRMGFEIGNHTWTHAGLNTPRAASRLAGELALVEQALAKVDVPKPVSFAWPGNGIGPEAVTVLRDAGYVLARRGMQPEIAYGSLGLGPLYDPAQHHQLLIPTAGDAYPDWNTQHFRKVVDRVQEGEIAVLQFHGVPDVAHPWVHTSPERFGEYMQYLKDEGFRVVAMRDLIPYLHETPIDNDPLLNRRHPESQRNDDFWPVEAAQTRAAMDPWLANMVYDHKYSIDEVARVTALPIDEIEAAIAALKPTETPETGVIKVRPYPGGRHPRIDFLEGAIDPMRGTKVSIFTPWDDKAYVVLDIPEAIFSNLGLLFLAHTHIPTIWDEADAIIENRDWTIEPDGTLTSDWTLLNGVRFGAIVKPNDRSVDLELWLENGTDAPLTGLRVQICAMLKGAPEFIKEYETGKRFEAPVAVAKSVGENRWLLIAFERCGRVWGNDRCPCIHSDPVLPDAGPGQRVSVRGQMSFYEGQDIEVEITSVRNVFLE